MRDPTPTTLRHDTRGAMMVSGLFIALFLVGCVAYLAGMARAIVHRDAMQEVADHAAFSSASMHALSMNFVAALNLVMLVMVVVHLMLGIVSDGLILIGIAVAIFDGGSTLDAGMRVRDKAWIPYFRDVLKPTLPALSKTQSALSLAAPWIASMTSFDTVRRYSIGGEHPSAYCIGPSQLPIAKVDELLGHAQQVEGRGRRPKAPERASHERLGLPVRDERSRYLCERLFETTVARAGSIAHDAGSRSARGSALGKAATAASKAPLGLGSGVPTPEKAVASAWRTFETLAVDRYCNSGRDTGAFAELAKQQLGLVAALPGSSDVIEATLEPAVKALADSKVDPGFDPLWGEDGPKVMWEPATNGSDWLQLWSYVPGAQRDDPPAPLVALVRRTSQREVGGSGPVPSPARPPPVFFAQSELYFDCASRWESPDCNDGEGATIASRATFAMRWRARLKRVRRPSFGGPLADFVASQIARRDMVVETRTATGDGARELEDGLRALSDDPRAAAQWLDAAKTPGFWLGGPRERRLRARLTSGGKGYDDALGIYH